MDLDASSSAVFWWSDETWPRVTGGQRVRRCGPEPVVYDGAGLPMEVVGAYRGLTQDRALYPDFRRHDAHCVPRLPQGHRTTVVRQAAHLCWGTAPLWHLRLDALPHDPRWAILESLPRPVSPFARAPSCRRLRGSAASGQDPVVQQPFDGFRLHARLCWPGGLTRRCVAPATRADPDVAPALPEGTAGLAVGDRLVWRPRLQEELPREGVLLLAPVLLASREPWPARGRLLSRGRSRSATVVGPRVARCALQRVWARDLWHRGTRLLRVVLLPTRAVPFTVPRHQPPLHLAALVA